MEAGPRDGVERVRPGLGGGRGRGRPRVVQDEDVQHLQGPLHDHGRGAVEVQGPELVQMVLTHKCGGKP